MRGSDERSGDLFSYVELEDRVPARHPLRVIRRVVNEVLVALDGEFSKIYADSGRPSIPPERLLRALLPARLAKILIKNDAPPDSIFHATRHTIATWLKKEKH